MAVIQLKGTRREGVGKGFTRKARAAGQIPGVVYGHGETPVAVAVDAKEFEIALRGFKGANPIVNLTMGSGKPVTALVRDVQMDPVTRGIIHLDFQHISLTEEIEVEVAVHCVGTPIGVKDGGGILEYHARSLKIRCLPTAIPPSIDVDVTALNVGQNLHVRDLTAQGYTIVTDADVTVAAVIAPIAEEAPAPETTEAAAAAAEPEVVAAKGKKDAEGAPAEPAKEAKKEKK
jgi:large subunit ribosomal protein L25